MKLYINQEQLNELSEKSKGKLIDWLFRNKHLVMTEHLNDIPGDDFYSEVEDKYNILLSIGQMIEFLVDNESDWVKTDMGDIGAIEWVTEILCDHLWEAVKEVLEILK